MLRQVYRAPVVVRTTLVLAGVLALSACQSDPGSSKAPSASPSVSASPTRTPSPTPTTQSPEDEAVEKAEQAVRDYYRVSSAARQDPESFNMEDLEKVSISSALLDGQNIYNVYLAEGTRQIGDISVELVDVHKVDLAHEPKADPPRVPEVQLMVCVDASDVNVVDRDGKSLSQPDRQVRNLFRVGVANYEYPTGPWLMAYAEPQESKTC